MRNNPIIVQKYGGACLETSAKIRAVASSPADLHIDGTQVKSSSFTVSGYYDRYSELLSTAMVRRRFVTGMSIHVGSSQPARA
jgi:aspartate kinase